MRAMSRPVHGTEVVWQHGRVSPGDRAQALRHRGATLWFTGLSGAGKSTVAVELERLLIERRVNAYRLDGDNVRHHLNKDLGFSPDDRRENIRRVAEVSRLFSDAGVVVLVALISPYRVDRDRARRMHDELGLAFFEVFVDTPLAECERRDAKGLYAKARSGELAEFTGVSAPYEAPSAPDVRLTPSDGSAETQARRCMEILRQRGVIRGGTLVPEDAEPEG